MSDYAVLVFPIAKGRMVIFSMPFDLWWRVIKVTAISHLLIFILFKS